MESDKPGAALRVKKGLKAGLRNPSASLMADGEINAGGKQNLQCACSITHNFMKPINRLREQFGRCLAQLAPKALCGQNANLADL